MKKKKSMEKTSGMKERGRKFPPLKIWSIVIQKRKKKSKREKWRKEKERKENKKKNSWDKKKEKRKREDFLAFRRSKLDGLSTKVGPRIAIYVWIPKTWSFDKLQEVGVSLLLGLLLV